MTRIRPRAYQVVVATPEGGAYHIVTTYSLDEGERFVGFDYLRLSYTVDDSAHTPLGQSFREQLRARDEASDAAEIPRNQEEERIRLKMQEAYGERVTVDIKRLTYDW